MTNLTVQQVIDSLQHFDDADLMLINKTLIGIAKVKHRAPGGLINKRELANATAKAQFNRGDSVEFTASRTNELIKGTIIKIAPKYIQVQTEEQEKTNRFWKVPATMLRKI